MKRFEHFGGFKAPTHDAVALDRRAPDRAATQFRLRKFYLDAVTEDGHCLIGYQAGLDFANLSLGYAATLSSPELTGDRAGPIFGAGLEPSWDTDRLTWRQPKLGVEGVWRPRAKPLRVQLFRQANGVVDWHCLQPAAQVALRTPSGSVVSALGYAELLTLTLPPWRLGLDQLIWGRFVSSNDALVWIDWRGRDPFQLVYWNGAPAPSLEISTRRVQMPNAELTIAPVRTLRDGHLGTTVLSKVPLARRLAPLSILQLRETKWLARGALRTANGRVSKGWIVHEKVTWPNTPRVVA